jgi:uncharacterized protein YjhX (UPF0386 family)
VQKIVHELEQGGLISISKRGRCNRYDINTRKNLRHPLQAGCTVGELLKALSRGNVSRRKPAAVAAEPAALEQKVAVMAEPPGKAKVPARAESALSPEAAPVVNAQADTTSKPAEKRGKKADTRQQGSLF